MHKMLQWDNFFNFVRFQRLRCQIVRHGSAIKTVNGDPIVRPFPKGQRSKERSSFQFCLISKVAVPNAADIRHKRAIVRFRSLTSDSEQVQGGGIVIDTLCREPRGREPRNSSSLCLFLALCILCKRRYINLIIIIIII